MHDEQTTEQNNTEAHTTYSYEFANKHTPAIKKEHLEKLHTAMDLSLEHAKEKLEAAIRTKTSNLLWKEWNQAIAKSFTEHYKLDSANEHRAKLHGQSRFDRKKSTYNNGQRRIANTHM